MMPTVPRQHTFPFQILSVMPVGSSLGLWALDAGLLHSEIVAIVRHSRKMSDASIQGLPVEVRNFSLHLPHDCMTIVDLACEPSYDPHSSRNGCITQHAQ
jgi:hypothetical protein